MKRILPLVLASVLAFIGCQEEPVGPGVNSPLHPAFNVTLENLSETKTELSQDNKVLWSEDDQIIAFEATTVGSKFKVSTEAVGKTSGIFEYVETVSNKDVTEASISANVAYYPFDKSVICNETSAGVYLLEEVELPEHQAYAKESFGPEAFPMVAAGKADSRNLAFRNVCGAIMFQIKGDVTVASINLKGHNAEPLSGEAEITAYADGSAPEIEMKSKALTGVSLNCGNGVSLSKTAATEFIIAVPPTVFEKGFTAVINSTDGKSMEFTTDKSNTVKRSAILKMPEITFEDGDKTFQSVFINDPGITYVWDESVIPEITIHMTKDEWNKLLKRYDEFDHNVDYFHADFTYKKGDEVHFIEDGGVRLRGNTSRRRPEGNRGQDHNSVNPDWHHCHFGINFRKYHKDNDHTINGSAK